MQSPKTCVILWMLVVGASVINGQSKPATGSRPVIGATAVASSSSHGGSHGASHISVGDKQNVQNINPSVAGVVGSLLGSIISGIGSGYRPGGGYYSGNGYFPSSGGYYPGGGYYPMNGGFYPPSGSYYPGSGFNSAFGGAFPANGGYYGNGQGYPSGVQASAVASQGYRPTGNQGYRPTGSGGYRPNTNMNRPVTVYGQVGNRPGLFQVASAYASSSSVNNGRPYQLIYIKRIQNGRQLTDSADSPAEVFVV